MNAEFEIYEDASGHWRWRLWSVGNSKIVADSGEGYYSPSDAERAVQWVKANAPTAPIRRS